MAQRIVTICDVHARDDVDHEGQTWTVMVQGPDDGKPRTWEIDLCADEGKPLDDLATMLGEVGRLVDGPRRYAKGATAARQLAHAAQVRTATAAPEWACPVPGGGKVPKNRGSLQSHVRNQHGISLAEALGQPLPYACEACGRKFSHPTGLAAHRRAAHDGGGGSGEG